MATVRTAARLHFGFQNLALAHERLYGGVGVALAEPRLVVEAERDDGVVCDDREAEPYARRVIEILEVPGAAVNVRDRYPRHVGLGSGTQLALATLLAVARAYGHSVDPRALAPSLGRGGRSGVGVAAVESGGFVVDGGHPTERFTAEPPDEGSWSVPPVVARHELPATWRFVVALPAGETGRSGLEEERSMRAVVERADPGIADDVAALLTRELLPAAASGDLRRFGRAAGRLGRLNGAWYADEQGGVYRPPAGKLIERLTDCPAVTGAGQSSWGPAVWAVTNVDRVDEVRKAAHAALDAHAEDGTVFVAAPRNEGATVED